MDSSCMASPTLFDNGSKVTNLVHCVLGVYRCFYSFGIYAFGSVATYLESVVFSALVWQVTGHITIMTILILLVEIAGVLLIFILSRTSKPTKLIF